MPAEFTSTVNFMAQPLAGAAAMSALGVGFASHAIGVWFGTMTAATAASQRMFLPMFEGFALDVDVFGDPREEAVGDGRRLDAASRTAIGCRCRKRGQEDCDRQVAEAAWTTSRGGRGRRNQPSCHPEELSLKRRSLNRTPMRRPASEDEPARPRSCRAVAPL